jgi:DNA repair exonuclease SbcCD ATPase subunit
MIRKHLSVIVLLSAGIFLSSCGGGSNEEMEKLKAENEVLKKDLTERDESVNDFMKSFNEIEENLLAVQQKERALNSGEVKNSAELGGDAKTRIEAEIQSINELMEKNKTQLSDLQKKLKKSNFKIGEFEKTIERLNQSIDEKNAEITALNEKLIALNYQVEGLNRNLDSLNTDTKVKSEQLTEKDNQLNEVYYAVGTKKELTSNGVLSNAGTFSGVKSGKKLDFNSSYFTKIDSRQTSEISINAKKAKLLSSHPSASYELTGAKLVIKDAAAFWKASKYCVIEVTK